MSILSVSSAASSRALLTIEQLRAVAGVTGNAQDAVLEDIGLRVSDQIAEFCRVAGDGVTPVTLLRETVVETFRLNESVDSLLLARRFVSSVSSVVEDGVTTETDEYEVDPGAGILYRLYDDERVYWPAGKIVVTYVAGFATVPSALVTAAMRLVQLSLSQTSRDPLARSERIRTEGVEEIQTDYWVGPLDNAAIPSDVADLLSPYMTRPMG